MVPKAYFFSSATTEYQDFSFRYVNGILFCWWFSFCLWPSGGPFDFRSREEWLDVWEEWFGRNDLVLRCFSVAVITNSWEFYHGVEFFLCVLLCGILWVHPMVFFSSFVCFLCYIQNIFSFNGIYLGEKNEITFGARR